MSLRALAGTGTRGLCFYRVLRDQSGTPRKGLSAAVSAMRELDSNGT